ncbi:MAG: alkaline phosphatase family protein [Planctomycetaceae bacterium]
MTAAVAYIQIKNNTSGRVLVQLYHKNSTDGIQSSGTIIESGATQFVLGANFQTGSQYVGVLDYWFLALHVVNGDDQGTYLSDSTSEISDPNWKECQLQSADAGQTLTFTVDTKTFNIALKSGPTSTSMNRIRDFCPIQNVFVLMLENHSFDNVFAFSGVKGVRGATTSNSNSYNGTTYNVTKGAPAAMPTDPGHEFNDVLEQVCGTGTSYSGGTYPNTNGSGFASNYATTTTEGDAPASSDIGDIMACFDTPNQLPVFSTLASNFTLCDQWYSSLPGPTWPNRFFVHAASSGGMDDSPSSTDMANWETVDGYTLDKGTIFDKIKSNSWKFAGAPSSYNLSYRLYNDCQQPPVSIVAEAAAEGLLGLFGSEMGPAEWAAVAAAMASIPACSLYSDNAIDSLGVGGMGWIPQVLSLNNISVNEIHSMSSFASDLSHPYDPCYTFIEPHYGFTLDSKSSLGFKGGSSQHPMDDTYGGEGLIKAVYEGIRNSPLWYTSILIITYDEHGGFYDSIPPVPGDAHAPDDKNVKGVNKHGFDFKTYGVRVPAVVVSPMVAAQMAHTVYDHSSVPATIEKCFHIGNLTNRDQHANSISDLCTRSIAGGSIRTDNVTLPSPVRSQSPAPAPKPEDLAVQMSQPLPKQGNLIGFLQILLKTELEVSDGTQATREAIVNAFKNIKTRGDAMQYAIKVAGLASKASSAKVAT